MSSTGFWLRLGQAVCIGSLIVLMAGMFATVPAYRRQQAAWTARWMAELERATDRDERRAVMRRMVEERRKVRHPVAHAIPLAGGAAVGIAMIVQARRREKAALHPTPAHRAREALARFPSTRYSTFWPRFWAGFLDSFALAPLNGLFLLLHPQGFHPVLSTLQTLAAYGYNIWLLTARGQTAGKWLCRVRVLDVAGEGPLRSWQAWARDSVPMFLSLVVVPIVLWRDPAGPHTARNTLLVTAPLLGWLALEIITMLFNEKRRALHDFLARTVVVRCAD